VLIKSESRLTKNIAVPELIFVPSGSVTLGAPPWLGDSTLPHPWHQQTVHVTAFGIGKYAVTVGEYLAFAEMTGYAISEKLRTDGRFHDKHAPVAYVSWIDAVRYTQWLARETAKPYRLVRDAEYERAARGGFQGKLYPWGDESPAGRCDYNNPGGSPLPVGSFAPNGYGVHDLAGSIWSWCEECYEQVASDRASMCYEDTQLPDTRLNPVCRGGSYKSTDPTVLRCAYRHEDPVDGRFDCIGFRLAMSLSS